MKTPKKKEVVKYFKNAKEVECVFDEESYNITVDIIRKIHKFNDGYWMKTAKGEIHLWDKNKGYAKILSYKEPKITAIAMRCNQEQFDKIKPKLKKAELVLGSCILNESWPYLINHYHDDDLDINKPSIGSYVATRNAKEIYEEWNENIFLEACGIEVKEPKEKTYKIKQEPGMDSITINDVKYIKEDTDSYKITTEQILEISEKFGNDNSLLAKSFLTTHLKQIFPEVFETKLTVGRWYKLETNKTLAFITELLEKKDVKAYGFNFEGYWVNEKNDWTFNRDAWTEATEQEVTEALTKEAVRRGYKNGNYNCLFLPNLTHKAVENFHYRKEDDTLYQGENPDSKNNAVYSKGQWAEIIPTLTIQEAEAKLNAKIV